MKHYLNAVSRAKQEGATAIEYALIAGLLVILIVVGVSTIGGNLGTIFTNVGTKTTQAAGNNGGGGGGN